MLHYNKSVELSVPVKNAFEFYTNTSSICETVPDSIDVKILQGGKHMKSGDVIRLKVRIFGIVFLWESKIYDMIPNVSFTDRMLKGPFKSWEHKHYFEKSAHGTTMTDRVNYEIPFGPIGLLANRLFVKNMIDKIFITRYHYGCKL